MYIPVIQTMSWEEHKPIKRKAMRILESKGYYGEPITPEEASVLWSYILDAPDQERDEPVDRQQECYDLIYKYDQDCCDKPEKESYNEREERINRHLRQVQQKMKDEQSARKQEMEALVTNCYVCKKALTEIEKFLGYCQEHMPNLDEIVF